MSLKINLHHLDLHEIHLKGELPVKELDFDLRDELVRVEKPLQYDLCVEKMTDSILVQGKFTLALECECARCLKPFEYTLRMEHWALHLPLEGEDAATIDNDCVDLTPFLREDILLEFPQHPLCKPECGGLKKTETGKARRSKENDGVKPSPWAELNKLKL